MRKNVYFWFFCEVSILKKILESDISQDISHFTDEVHSSHTWAGGLKFPHPPCLNRILGQNWLKLVMISQNPTYIYRHVLNWVLRWTQISPSVHEIKKKPSGVKCCTCIILHKHLSEVTIYKTCFWVERDFKLYNFAWDTLKTS